MKNNWSCLPRAFAIALNIPFDNLILLIGHDGSEIIWDELSEPQCRRGFHIQECIEACLQLGHSVTPVELYPRHTPLFGIEPITVLFGDEVVKDTNPVRFQTHIYNSRGVITGIFRGCGHAVAYDRGIILDDNLTYQFSLENCRAYNFIPQCVWIIK